MLKKLGKTEIVISVLALFTVIAITFAAFTEQLTITGSATAKSATWKIQFASLSEASLTGSAKEITAPKLAENNTAIKTFSFEFDGTNDSISYTFSVINDGDVDAVIQAIDLPTPVCTNSDGQHRGSIDGSTGCSHLTYRLRYGGGGSFGNDVSIGDTLKAGASTQMTFTLGYFIHPCDNAKIYDDVRVSNVDLTLTYAQA